MAQRKAKDMLSIVEAYLSHEGTRESFCLERGIKVHVLDYWRRKLCGGTNGESSNRFVALEVENSGTNLDIELHYPNGNWLVMPQGTSLSVLQALVKTCC
jgi:hypothetical protein